MVGFVITLEFIVSATEPGVFIKFLSRCSSCGCLLPNSIDDKGVSVSCLDKVFKVFFLGSSSCSSFLTEALLLAAALLVSPWAQLNAQGAVISAVCTLFIIGMPILNTCVPRVLTTYLSISKPFSVTLSWFGVSQNLKMEDTPSLVFDPEYVWTPKIITSAGLRRVHSHTNSQTSPQSPRKNSIPPDDEDFSLKHALAASSSQHTYAVPAFPAAPLRDIVETSSPPWRGRCSFSCRSRPKSHHC
ncbi:hypothetical protein IWZ01DRAFT_321239 [Phyllosticta capitalensis]